MKFSNMELQSLNSLIDKQPIYGLSLENEEVPKEKQGIEFVLTELKKKRILDENNNLTKQSILVVESLRLYKKAREYIFINNLRISKNEDNSVTIIYKGENEYEVMRKSIDELLIAIVYASEGLKSAQVNVSDANIKKINKQQWEDKCISDDIKEFIVLHRYKLGKLTPVTRCVYYWQKQKGYVYDELVGALREAGSRDIRLEIAEELGCKWKKVVI